MMTFGISDTVLELLQNYQSFPGFQITLPGPLHDWEFRALCNCLSFMPMMIITEGDNTTAILTPGARKKS